MSNRISKLMLLVSALSIGPFVVSENTHGQDRPAEYYWNLADIGEFADGASWSRLDPNPVGPGVNPFTPAAGSPEARIGEIAFVGRTVVSVQNSQVHPDGTFTVGENGGVATVSGFIQSTVDSAEATPGGLVINNGTVDIETGGQLRVVAFAGPGLLGGTYDIPGVTEVRNAGILAVEGNGVFETESLTFVVPDNNPGTLRTTVRDSQFNAIHVNQTASLAGNLEVGFSGEVSRDGGSWTLVDAGVIDGSFESVTASGLPIGQFITVQEVAGPGGRRNLNATIDQEALVLEVDLTSGNASITKRVGDSVALDGYQIRSPGSFLDSSDSTWTALGEQFPASQWRESNASANQLSELEPSGSLSISGSGFSLGNVYNPPPPTEFRADREEVEDLSFSYTTAEGERLTGFVDYINEPVNDLLVTVDPIDGEVRLSNPTIFSVGIEAYQISSASGSLDSSGWTSLDDRDGPSNNDGGWRESNPSSSLIGELLQAGVDTLSPGVFFDLGDIFDATNGDRDLVFEFLMEGDTTPLVGTVVYESFGDGLAGDFNSDGRVNGADFLAWQRGESPNGVTAGDLAAWQQSYGNVGGATAIVAVPEPAAGVLGALGAYFCWLLSGRRACPALRSKPK